MSDSELVRAGQLVNRSVRGADGGLLGRIHDVVVDPRTGRIAYALVAAEDTFDEVLGPRAALFPVPFGALRYGEELTLSATLDRLTEAPGLEGRKVEDLADPVWAAELHRHYGVDPYWARSEHPEQGAPGSGDEAAGRKDTARGWALVGVALVAALALAAYAAISHPAEAEVTTASLARAAERAAEAVKHGTVNAGTTLKVKTAFVLSKRVPALDIDVDSSLGVVTLSGTVPSQRMRRSAAAIARDTSGVSEVVNRLVVDRRETSRGTEGE